MISIGSKESAKDSFACDRPTVQPSLVDKPKQKLEWLILATLIPVLAVPSMTAIHGEVVRALQVLRQALYLSDMPGRVKGFFRAILGILGEIVTFLTVKAPLTFPCDCPIKMSAFKGTSNFENDPTWLVLRFSELDDAMSVLCCLLSMSCVESDSTNWPGHVGDGDLRMGLMAHICSVLKMFLPNGTMSQKKQSGSYILPASAAAIHRLYQACSFCVMEAIPLLNADCRHFPALAESLLIILYHHVMTVQERCEEFNAMAALRKQASKVKAENIFDAPAVEPPPVTNIKGTRSEMPVMAVLETALAKALTALVECAQQKSWGTTDFYGVRALIMSLFFSDQLLLLSDDESGMNVQRAILQLIIRFVPSGAFTNPLEAIDYTLSRFTHLEADILAEVVLSCLGYWENLGDIETPSDSRAATQSSSSFGGQFAQFNKRTIEDVDSDFNHTGVSEAAGKRARREVFQPTSASLESGNTSSIIYSQLSQRPAKPPGDSVDGTVARSSSQYLLRKLKTFGNVQTLNFTAGQGSRGIQPPLTIEDLRSIVIFVRVWIKVTFNGRSSNCVKDIDQLSSVVASIGKYYLLWALSPGMQNTTLNQSYLESSYPLILDLIAPLCSLKLSDALNEILICLSSGPWFTDLSRPEFWHPSSDSMDIDSISGEQQLARSLLGIMEGTEILLRLRDNPNILQACQSFHPQASKAMKVMVTFPRCSQLDTWRNELLVNSLKANRGSRRLPGSDFSTRSLTITALESLAVLSTRCPDTKATVHTAISSLILEDEHEETRQVLASCMGVIACGIANADRNTEATYSYDATREAFILHWRCPDCNEQANASGSMQSARGTVIKLDQDFLSSFHRLTVVSKSTAYRLALLDGIYRVYCHLSVTHEEIVDVDMGDDVVQGFRDFVMGLLSDPDDAIRDAAGGIVELLVKRMGESLADDPLRHTGHYKDMTAIQDAISKGFINSLRGQRFTWLLQLCRRIMRHLPEDNLTYHAILCMMVDHAFLDRGRLRSVMVFDVLSSIARDKGVTNYRLLRPKMDYICGKIIQMLESGHDGQLQTFYSWSGLSQERFLDMNLSGLLPKMVVLYSPELIKRVAAILKRETGRLCIDEIDHILAEIFMEQDDIAPCIDVLRSIIVEQDPNRTMESIALSQLTTVSVAGLLCRLCHELGHEDYVRREKAKSWIADVEEHVWATSKLIERPTLAMFMRRHFLAVMSEVNTAILDRTRDVTLRTKAKHLRSLAGLVMLLQPVQSSVLTHIYSPLNIALGTRGLRIHALHVLRDIVHGLEQAQLGVLLVHVTHALMRVYPCSNAQERLIEQELLQYLIVQSQDALKDILPDVGMLPDIPEFEEMNKVLSASKGQLGLETQLRRLIQRANNDSSELAEQALVELRGLLVANDTRILSMAAKGGEQSSVVSELIHGLLSGIGRFRGLDAPVPRLCADCLGIIGAVDPAKVSSPGLVINVQIPTNFNDLEEAKDFVCRLIEIQLVGQTRTIGDIRAESDWAYVLQTLLAFCGITKDVLESEGPFGLTTRALLSQRHSAPSSQNFYTSTPSSAGLASKSAMKSARDRWRSFPSHVHEVLELLIDAKYSRSKPSAQPEYICPLYRHVRTFKDWLTNWTLALIATVSGQNVSEIFQACRHVARNDTSMCLFILPHLVLNVLLDGSDKDKNEVIREMSAVLSDGRDWSEDGAGRTFGVQNQPTSELYQLGSQTVFTLFDHISKWIHIRKNFLAKTAGLRSYGTAESPQAIARQQAEAQCESVVAHLSSISHNHIAVAAFRSKAYARALYHYEQHIRDRRMDSALDDVEIQSMYGRHQEIYVHMDEPDGMEGISTLITSGTLTQNLLQCESAGRWAEAHAYYELALQAEPGHFEHHVGLYRTMENLGQFDTLLTSAEGDILNNPSWEQALNDYRISAAWKAERYESLEAALTRSSHTSFESGLGLLISDLYHNRASDFEIDLQRTRSMLLAPIAAASMDSYSRAYEHVVRLHMLHELEVAFKSFHQGVSSTDGALNSAMINRLPDAGGYVERLRSYQSRLDQRFDSMAPTFRIREQVARLRRIAFYDIRMSAASPEEMKFLKEGCGRLWLQSASSARKAGQDEMWFGAILHAERLDCSSAVIERAKWGFSHKNERQAMKAIDTALKRASAASASSNLSGARSAANIAGRLRHASNDKQRYPNPVTTLQRVQDSAVNVHDDGFIRAKATLLRTRWLEKGSLVSPHDIIAGFSHAVAECDSWEKGYFSLGQYCFKLFETSRRSRGRVGYGYATQACKLFGKALSLGPKYLYQIMPRLLTYWLELANLTRQEQQGTTLTTVQAEFENVNKLMKELANVLPEYMFLSAFPQIISRICHKNVAAVDVLENIIVKVVLAYPDQAIWQMVSVSKSVVPERKRVCNRILDTIPRHKPDGPKTFELIKEALDLGEHLISLCMASVPDKVSKLSLEKNFNRIFRQLKRDGYNVAIPCQKTLWPALPASSATMASHKPFKSDLPKIDKLLDEIEVMSSLQRPRKVTIVGSDGQRYTYLCKPKDDLRKDAKMTEFNCLVNYLLNKNREAHRRNLYIRSYAVVPLNEECGLIEWVHNTIPFRYIMQRQLRSHNVILPPIADIKRLLDHEDRVRIFSKELLPKFPPVFHQWLKDIAPEPTEWFATRLRYARTTAVMSMVGYIMGLGDRHAENLLFDERTGDTVHVDFNCLFEQGKTFPKPEKVPFRLTNNMVDAMGLSGYDGVFRASCELTLQVLRENSESLIAVLEGFLHDPLVEWSKGKKRGQQLQQAAIAAAGGANLIDPLGDDSGLGAGDEARARLQKPRAAAGAGGGDAFDAEQNEKAQAILTQTKKKLTGTEGGNHFVLTVQGQADDLIQAATSVEHLSAMYIGWSSYL
ncbi:serine/threonine-protein kinase M1 [Mortierella alpina]|nr:serine/threonine-protein kinase M1 [Mortierella alpina]